jgi:Domain of unknown function (DUF4926)
MTEWFLQSLFPTTGLSSDDVGVVVHVYPRQEAYEVEFVTLAGQTAAIVTRYRETRLLNPTARTGARFEEGHVLAC